MKQSKQPKVPTLRQSSREYKCSCGKRKYRRAMKCTECWSKIPEKMKKNLDHSTLRSKFKVA